MDILTTILDKKFTDMQEELINNGFNLQQTIDFIPDAISYLIVSIRSSTDRYFYTIDYMYIDNLKEKTGLDDELVREGLQILFPFVNSEISNFYRKLKQLYSKIFHTKNNIQSHIKKDK